MKTIIFISLFLVSIHAIADPYAELSIYRVVSGDWRYKNVIMDDLIGSVEIGFDTGKNLSVFVRHESLLRTHNEEGINSIGLKVRIE